MTGPAEMDGIDSVKVIRIHAAALGVCCLLIIFLSLLLVIFEHFSLPKALLAGAYITFSLGFKPEIQFKSILGIITVILLKGVGIVAWVFVGLLIGEKVKQRADKVRSSKWPGGE
jgi:hypothetical protein